VVTVAVDPTTGQVATEACPYRVNEVFPEWQAPTEPCRRHQPGAGQYAMYGQGQDGEVEIDPATGQPVYPYDVYQNDEGRIEISNFGYGYGQEAGAAMPEMPAADALPDPSADPLTDDVEDVEMEPLPEPEPTVDPNAGPGIIEIRPSRPRPEPTPTQTPVVEVTPEETVPGQVETTPVVEETPPPPF
jgi:hypothetical protein